MPVLLSRVCTKLLLTSLLILVVLGLHPMSRAIERNMLMVSWVELRMPTEVQPMLWTRTLDRASQRAYAAMAENFKALCRRFGQGSAQPCLRAREAAWMVSATPENALIELQHLSNERPQQVTFAIFAGDYLYASGISNAGVEIWRRYLPLGLLISRANIAADEGDFTSSSEILSGLDPARTWASEYEKQNLVKVLGKLAMFTLTDGKFSDSEFYWRWAANLSPNDAIYYRGLGEALAAQNLLPEALAAAQFAVNLDSKCPLCYVDLAKVLMEMGMMERAIASLETAIHLDPQNTAARDLLRNLSQSSGKPD